MTAKLQCVMPHNPMRSPSNVIHSYFIVHYHVSQPNALCSDVFDYQNLTNHWMQSSKVPWLTTQCVALWCYFNDFRMTANFQSQDARSAHRPTAFWQTLYIFILLTIDRLRGSDMPRGTTQWLAHKKCPLAFDWLQSCPHQLPTTPHQSLVHRGAARLKT